MRLTNSVLFFVATLLYTIVDVGAQDESGPEPILSIDENGCYSGLAIGGLGVSSINPVTNSMMWKRPWRSTYPLTDGQFGIFNMEGGGVVVIDMESNIHIVLQLQNANSVVRSPDGSVIATSSDDGVIRLWDALSGRLHGKPLKGHTASINQIVWSPNGKLLASASSDRTVRLWDVENGKQHGQPLVGHSGTVQSVTFSPDGAIVASGSGDQSVRVWNVDTSDQIGDPLRGHIGIVNAVAWSPDGSMLASAAGSRLHLWDTYTMTQHGNVLLGHSGFIYDLAWSPDSRTLASAGDRTVRLWEAATGLQQREPLTGHGSAVHAVSWFSDGTQLISAGRHSVRRWDVSSGLQVGKGQSFTYVGAAEYVANVAWSPNGKHIAAVGEGAVTIRDGSTGEIIQILEGHEDYIYTVAWSPDGKMLASGSSDRTIRLWDFESGQQIKETLKGHTDWVNSVEFSPDGRKLASASDDKTVRVWDIASHKEIGEPMVGHTEYVYSVTWSPDGRTLASAGDRTVRLWDPNTFTAIGTPITGHRALVNSVAWSPDGTKLASASDDKLVRIWDVETATQIQELRGHEAYVNSAVWSKDGSIIATGSDDQTVRLWNAEDGSLRSIVRTGLDGSLGNSVSWSNQPNLCPSINQIHFPEATFEESKHHSDSFHEFISKSVSFVSQAALDDILVLDATSDEVNGGLIVQFTLVGTFLPIPEAWVKQIHNHAIENDDQYWFTVTPTEPPPPTPLSGFEIASIVLGLIAVPLAARLGYQRFRSVIEHDDNWDKDGWDNGIEFGHDFMDSIEDKPSTSTSDDEDDGYFA